MAISDQLRSAIEDRTTTLYRIAKDADVDWGTVQRFLDGTRANIRIDWIHTPGSDLFLVLNTGYFQGDLLNPHDERWVNRAGVIKLTYLKAF